MSTPRHRHAVRERCNALKRELRTFETTFLDKSQDTPESQALRHEVINQSLEGVLNQANHLRKAVELGCPEVIDQDLADRIRHLRNIYEHWEQHRTPFLETGAEARRSAKWFAERYGDRSPFTYEWSKVGGFRIGSIIGLSELHDLIDRAREAVGTPPGEKAA